MSWKPCSETLSYERALEIGAITDRMTEQAWYSLTPGMRREIVRQHLRGKA